MRYGLEYGIFLDLGPSPTPPRKRWGLLEYGIVKKKQVGSAAPANY
jgi:hypothetical protein